MIKNKIFLKIFIFISIFVTLFSFSVLYANSDVGGQENQEALYTIPDDMAKYFTQKTEDKRTTTEELKESLKNQQAGALEMTVSELCLSVGDHFMEYINFLLKEEVTIDKIILFNF